MNICLETKIDDHAAMMVESEDGFTMSLLERGGPIITGRTKEECLEKFREAMDLMVSVMKLMEFGRSKTFDYKKK